jgi:transcriptional regulator with XRE-family HTH domain
MTPGNKLRMLLGQNIKQLRSSRRMSQADLAEKADISIPFISEIERGNKWPQPDNLANIALALGVEVYDLFRPVTLDDGETQGSLLENAAALEVKIVVSKLAENISSLANESVELLNKITRQAD